MTTTITAVRAIPTSRLRRHPSNIREQLGDVTELAQSLRAQGVLQPLLVAPRTFRGEDLYVVLDGHRRLAAARQVSIPRLPCLITTEGTHEQTLSTMLAAAMHERVGPLDQARAFQLLIDEGLSLNDLASATGYCRRTIRNRLALLELPRRAQDMITNGDLTLAAARDLSQQVRDQRRTGSEAAVPRAAVKQGWLDNNHPLAEVARSRCTEMHRTTRVTIGRVACGQCWQEVIEQHADPRVTTVRAAG